MTKPNAFQITDFSGFQYRETQHHDFSIYQTRGSEGNPNAEFELKRITFKGKVVWPLENSGIGNVATGTTLLRWIDDDPIIILVKGRELHDVIPVRDLPYLRMVAGEYVGESRLSNILILKSIIADEECLTPVWSERESTLRQALEKAEEREAAMYEAEQMVEAERVRRQAREAIIKNQ